MKKVNVAVSIGLDPAANLWASGLNQNLAFLVRLLRCSDIVGKVWLVHPGSEAAVLPPGLALESTDVPLVRTTEITHDVDLVLEFGASLPLEWLKRVRALGARVVAFLVGHTYAGQVESSIFGRSGGTVFVGSPWDEAWTLPHHMKTSAPLLRTVTRAPVHSVPHIWSPRFLEASVREVEAAGLSFGFQPSARRPWRVAIFEPNISVVKSCFIPLLVCEEAYRRKREAVDVMMAMNTVHMKEHRTFKSLALRLDLTRDHRAWYEPRQPFAACMAQHRMDAVVAHQWECGLNYAYYDALHGGYPLVHNSEFLRDAGLGFHYPDFAAGKGAEALLRAWEQEPEFWPDYRARSAAHLAQLAPDHPRNIDAFSRRILEVVGDRLDG